MGELVGYGAHGSPRFGYLALPAGGTGPGIVVLQEWWGLVEHITSVADLLAEAGYVALAPDLYRDAVAGDLEAAKKLSHGLAMDQAATEIADAAGHVVTYAGGSRRAGIVGFGMGGSLALWSAAFADEIVAAVGFYPPRASMAPRWEKYAGKTAMIHAAEADGGSAAPGVTEAVASIVAAGGEVEVYDYPGTQREFFNEDRLEVYDPAAAKLAWDRTLDLFTRALPIR